MRWKRNAKKEETGEAKESESFPICPAFRMKSNYCYWRFFFSLTVSLALYPPLHLFNFFLLFLFSFCSFFFRSWFFLLVSLSFYITAAIRNRLQCTLQLHCIEIEKLFEMKNIHFSNHFFVIFNNNWLRWIWEQFKRLTLM